MSKHHLRAKIYPSNVTTTRNQWLAWFWKKMPELRNIYIQIPRWMCLGLWTRHQLYSLLIELFDPRIIFWKCKRKTLGEKLIMWRLKITLSSSLMLFLYDKIKVVVPLYIRVIVVDNLSIQLIFWIIRWRIYVVGKSVKVFEDLRLTWILYLIDKQKLIS